MDTRFKAEMAEIFEIDESAIQPDMVLTADNWNSLAIVSTIALADDLYSVLLSGQALSKCKTLGDVTMLIAKEKDNP